MADARAWGRQRAVRLLEHHALTHAAAKETRSALATASEWREVQAGDPLFGAAEGALAFVETGAVRLWDAGVDPWVAGYGGPGDLVGEEVLGGVVPGATAMTAVTLLVVPAAVLDELTATDAGLRRALHEHFVSLRAEDQAGRRLALFGTVRQRLAAFLLDAVERWGAPVARGVRVDVPLAQPEVAAAIGATRKMVGITLRALEREGVLERTGRKILVLDHDKLAAAGHPRQVSAIPSDASPRARRKVTGA